jgi:hypothetical protein
LCRGQQGRALAARLLLADTRRSMRAKLLPHGR